MNNYYKAILIPGPKMKSAKTEAFLDPFYIYRKDLLKKFHFIFDELRIKDNADEDELSKLKIDFSNYDVMFFCIPFKKSKQRFLQDIKIKKVFFDTTSTAGYCQFDLLPYIDLYVAGQFLKNLNDYKISYLENSILADYFLKLYNIEGPICREPQPLQEEFKKKLILGWNFVSIRRFYNQFKKQGYRSYIHIKPHDYRTVDITCRVSLNVNKMGRNRWYYLNRISLLNKLQELKDKYKIIGTGKQASIKTFLRELRNSKICVSPFGWAELSERDFHAIISGCLLIKQSIEHIVTEPNLFIANETYVPVRWDLSDLNEKCEYYLTHEKERERIIKNAEEAYARYFKERGFVTKIEEILNKLGFKTKNYAETETSPYEVLKVSRFNNFFKGLFKSFYF